MVPADLILQGFFYMEIIWLFHHLFVSLQTKC